MVIVYAIIMSSWKQYGGMNNFEKAGQIEAYSITVNKLVLKETYQGNFDICGQLLVYGDAQINGVLTVKEGMDISGNTIIGEPGSSLIVNSDSIFNGLLQLNSTFDALGNIQSSQNIISDKDILVGRVLDFSGGSFLHSSGNAFGLNTMTPLAALDISTNFVNGIIVSGSNDMNNNILAQNRQQKGITLGVDLSSTYMYFNYDTPIPGIADGSIYYTPGGYLFIDVSKNVNISCPMTVSVEDNTTHLRSEVFTVYDISQVVYFGNIYQNEEAYTGLAAAFVADSSNSNTFTFMGTPEGSGLSVGGGAYPVDVTKAMGTIGLTDVSGIYSPAQVIVSGNSTNHLLTTTGINTYKPRINSYVLDVNGPIHVDNGGIASIDTDPSFELYSISVAPDNRNVVVGLGSSIEVENDIPVIPNPPLPKEKLIVSNDGGLSWSYVDVSNSAGIFSGTTVLKGDVLNNIHLYNSTNWFITGQNNMIANSYDGGATWQNIFTTGFANDSNFKNVYINPVGNLNSGNVFGYFSVDVSLVLFEVPIDGSFTNDLNKKIITSQLSSISAIRANSETIYLAGNYIAKFNASNSVINQTPVLQWEHSYGTSYSYNDLQIFDNSYVIAVGDNIISTTTDGGLSWQDISFNSLFGGQGVNFTGVHMADISNAIAVGSQGNIWITKNQGSSWSSIPINLINPSGESQRLLNGNNRFRNVVMTNNNTILITNTLQSYSYVTNTYGKSSIFTVYAPNFINNANNMVLDISGGVRISGDMYINDGGLIGSNNTSFSLLNSGVKNISFGGDTTSMVIGSLVGNTEIRNNVVIPIVSSSTSSATGALRVAGGVGIGGNLNVAGRMNVVSEASFNDNVIITSTRTSSDVNTGALVVNGGVGIGGNLYIGGTIGNDLDVIGNIRADSLIPNKSTFSIGNPNDISTVVTINGTVSIPTLITSETSQTVSSSPTILVNQKTDLGNATSAGSGIAIFDNSNVDMEDLFNVTNNIVAYMVVGKDLQSFVFKAPSIGSIDGTSSGSLSLISPQNRVRLAINEMTFLSVSSSPNRIVNRGLVILQTNASFKQYQTERNHAYGDYSDADYAINICPDFDISNILLKEFDTVVGRQTISTNLNIGNTLAQKNITVFGDIISNGNIGIRTINPLVSLDVSGSSRFVGPLVSTNYDTLRFSTNYGRPIQNNLNQAPTEKYYQDAAISYDGQFQYGLLYDRTGVGSVNASRDYGTTWSQTSLPLNYSGNIIYQAVPYMNENTNYFSFNSLAGNITLANAIPLNIQVGTYQASGSSFQNTNEAYYVFDGLLNTFWQSEATADHSYSGGAYVGSVNTTTINETFPINGEYVQINLPYSFCLTNYQFYPLDTFYNNFYPSTIYVCGSNDNSDWVNLTPTGNSIIIPVGFDAGGNTFVSISNTVSYNSYRFIVYDIKNTPLTNQSTYISRIDLSGIFQNVTGSFSSSMATSGTGEYVTVANQGYYAGQGNLITSSNYGVSFTDTEVRDTGAVWQSVAISHTGIFQVAVSQNLDGFGNIWLSYNSGSSWVYTESQRIQNGWQSVSISSTGQYITAISATSSSDSRGNILISSDYGNNWITGLSNQIYNYIEPVNGFLNLGLSDFNKTVCVSSSGQYQTALGLALSSQTNGTATIWISSDYGVNWRDTGARAPVINDFVSVFTSITMNGSGENQIATFMTENIVTGLRSQVYGNALVSSDYGDTWLNIDYTIPSVPSSGNVYYGGVTKVQSSLNGQYVFGMSKYQDICGNTYTNNTNTAFGVGNIYLSSVPVTTGLLTTQYFGSANSGNVLQTHGLELSVPNANNAALIAGYDVNWNSGYINSADQTGSTSLGLNTTGGFIGVGKITPAATLDISGDTIISGQLIIGGISSPTLALDVFGNIKSTGTITASNFNATSDYRMKKNTQPLLITRTVDLLKPVEYDLLSGTHDMGFLADEVQEVLPFLVTGEKDGEDYQRLNYNGFIALLVKEVQGLKKENRELKKLEERIYQLEQRFM